MRNGILTIFLLLTSLLGAATVLGSDGISISGGVSSSVVEGTLTQVSKLPQAEGNSYPDCYFTAILEIHHIVSGKSVPKRLVVVLPGFFARKYAPEARLKQGDKVGATLSPFASMPDKVRQTQQADEIEEVDLEFYFAKDTVLLQHFTAPQTAIPFSQDKDSAVQAATAFQPVDLDARAARQSQIRKDLEEINGLLTKHGGDWNKWYDSLAGFRDQYKKQYEAKAQRWVGDSFFSAGYVENGYIYRPEFVESVINFKNYLSARNVDLILVRVPKKGEIVDDLFATAPADKVSNPHLLRMYKELLEADVEIINDIIPRAKEKRFEFPLMYWYQDFSEDHPAEGISWVIAEELAKRVSRYKSVKAAPRANLALKKTIATPGWLGLKWPTGNPKYDTSDFVRFAGIVDEKNRPLSLKQGEDSPILIVGSSFIAAPSLSKGATIPHYFAYITGIIPDLVHRNDADYMMPRSLAREGDSFLRNKVVCLFPFVPWSAYKALASLPIFDPNKSDKILLASYSNATLREIISLIENSEGRLTFSEDSANITPPENASDTGVKLRLTVPNSISDYSHFILSLEFASVDRTNISVQYSGQLDGVKRSDTQNNNEELFTFVTKPEKLIDIALITDKVLRSPIKIKKINFYGVKKPVYYQNKSDS